MSDSKKVVLDITDQSLSQLESVAEDLKTTPASVISQALALFLMVQGKKVIIKDQQQNKDLIIDTYSKSTAQKGNK
jgi:hypothetical protein